MKLFNFHILKQKTLDGRLADARKESRAVPNKMISILLKNQAGQPMVKQLLEEYQKLQGVCHYLREKVRSAS